MAGLRLLPRDDSVDELVDWSDVELPPKSRRDQAAERAAAAGEADGAGAGAGGLKKRLKGGYAEYDTAGYCRSRQAPNTFHGRFWRRLEIDPRDAPLTIRVNGGRASATVAAASLNMTTGTPTFGLGSATGSRPSTPLLLTAAALKQLPRERGGLLMRLLLEGDVPEGVTPR